MEQRIRFCAASYNARIAYATSGTRPPVVKTAHWLTHIEHDWTSPAWRHSMTERSSCDTLIRYDQRGCGLSNWQDADFGKVISASSVHQTLP